MKIACCFLTHNHPDVVDYIIHHAGQLYSKYNIDMLFCDDSDNLKTAEIIKNYLEVGFNNVRYVDAHDALTGDGKYLRALKKEYVEENYDYIWICKDRIYYQESMIKKLIFCCEKKYDLQLMTDPSVRVELIWPDLKEEYTDPVEFFAHWGRVATNWEGMVYNTKTFLAVKDWDTMCIRYGLNESNPFNQLVFVFARFAEKSGMTARVIPVVGGELVYCPYATSMWGKQVFEIWIDRWIPAIFSLPDIYSSYKLHIIKSQTNLPQLFGSVDRLVQLTNDNILTKEVFNRYRSSWEMLSDIPAEYVDMILDDRIEELKERIIKYFENCIVLHDLDEAFYIFVRYMGFFKQTLTNQNYENMGRFWVYYKQKRILGEDVSVFNSIVNCDQLIQILSDI